MHGYTVMRHATVEDGGHGNGNLWVAWDVEANTPQQAVETAADVPAEYIVLEADPIYITVEERKVLKVATNGAQGGT